MIIRHQQMEAAAKIAEDSYVTGAVAHLERYDPPLAAAAGRPGLEKLARDGLTAARQYKLDEGRALQLYLELMMSLGSGFDSDPQFKWLHIYLQPSDGVGTIERARLLHFHAVAYLDRAYGERAEYGRSALQRAAMIKPERLRDLGADLDSKAGTLVQWLHPQRMDFLDQDALVHLVSSARQDAAASGLPPGEGAALLFLLQFTFGHRVLSDPLYPWLPRQLKEAGPADPAARMDRLVTRTQTYFAMMQRTLGGAEI